MLNIFIKSQILTKIFTERQILNQKNTTRQLLNQLIQTNSDCEVDILNFVSFWFFFQKNQTGNKKSQFKKSCSGTIYSLETWNFAFGRFLTNIRCWRKNLLKKSDIESKLP